MADIISLDFIDGRNFSILRSSVSAVSTEQMSGGSSDFMVYTLPGQSYALKYGGSNPETWSQVKALLFGNNPVVDLELPAGEDITIRKDAVKAINEVSATDFSIQASWSYAFKYGGDNPASWSALKTLVFGP